SPRRGSSPTATKTRPKAITGVLTIGFFVDLSRLYRPFLDCSQTSTTASTFHSLPRDRSCRANRQHLRTRPVRRLARPRRREMTIAPKGCFHPANHHSTVGGQNPCRAPRKREKRRWAYRRSPAWMSKGTAPFRRLSPRRLPHHRR